MSLGVAALVKINLKWATGLKGYSFWQTLHFTSPRMRFVDKQLNPNVGWARHALAIDERRKDFDRVPWGIPNDGRRVGKDEPEWFKQVWFAGCHSDVGGSYVEPESRLSDIALDWMVKEVKAVPGGLQVDDSVLKVFPSALGMQHDETRSWAFRFGSKIDRQINPDAPLHATVLERFAATAVRQYDLDLPYRPEGLRTHHTVSHYYQP